MWFWVVSRGPAFGFWGLWRVQRSIAHILKRNACSYFASSGIVSWMVMSDCSVPDTAEDRAVANVSQLRRSKLHHVIHFMLEVTVCAVQYPLDCSACVHGLRQSMLFHPCTEATSDGAVVWPTVSWSQRADIPYFGTIQHACATLLGAVRFEFGVCKFWCNCFRCRRHGTAAVRHSSR